MLTEWEKKVLAVFSPLARGSLGHVIRGAKRQGDDWVLIMSRQELALLVDSLLRDINFLAPGRERDTLAGILDRASVHRASSRHDVISSDGSFRGPGSDYADFMKQIREALEGKDLRNLAEANEVLAGITKAYNEKPMDEFFGLSPIQMSGLLDSGWWKEPRSIILGDNLLPEDLEKAPMLHNCKLLMGIVANSGGVGSTATGNLKRETVKKIFERAIYKEYDLFGPDMEPTVMNENDVMVASITRAACEAAGLLKIRNGRFSITANGAALLESGKDGILYRNLFENYFRKFNLAYCDGLSDLDSIQETFPYTLYRLGVTGEGSLKGEPAKSLMHPNAVKDVEADKGSTDDLGRVLDIRVLMHLEVFSLVEVSREQKNWITRPVSFRKKGLFDRFIKFRV